ncbi:MAG TPA: hypothetical protein VJX10_22515 [Pseudonocardiaceae bacterium]|nr:hypothetical protein [Pseudonocardiaceae bacterium]
MTPLLLQGQGYAIRAPATTAAPAPAGHDPADDGDGEPRPCVLVLARSTDVEMTELSAALAVRGVRVARIDADRCLDLSLTVYPDAPLVELDNAMLRPVLVWRRHFEPAALPVDPGTLYGAYVVDQWRSVADWITARTDWSCVNAGRPVDRLTQLAAAARFGLAVPRTVVTTQPARHRPGGGTCVVKTTGQDVVEPLSGHRHGLGPRPVDPRLGGGRPEPAPVIVQQYLPSDHELRVFVVGERVIGYRVDRGDPGALWLDPAAARVRPVPVEPALGGTLRALARHWRLDIAAFDLLVRDGTPAFLAAGAHCDWRWCEHLSGEPAVSAAVANWVTARFEELHGAATRTGAARG